MSGVTLTGAERLAVLGTVDEFSAGRSTYRAVYATVEQVVAARLADADARVTAAEAERAEWERVAMKWTHRCSDEHTRAKAAEGRLAAVLAGIEALADKWDETAGMLRRNQSNLSDLASVEYVARAQDLRALASPDGTALARVKAEAWGEAVTAVAWCLDNGEPSAAAALAYVAQNNPYRIEAEAGDS